MARLGMRGIAGLGVAAIVCAIGRLGAQELPGAAAPPTPAALETPATSPDGLTATPTPVPTPTPEPSPWFPFRPMVDEFVPTVVDCSRFVDAPAGRRGFVRVDGEQFVFEDGTPARFWGAQIDVFPKNYMDYAAKRLRKLGINAVRFRSLELLQDAQAGSLLELNAEGLDQLDYAISRLAEEGIYVMLVLDEPARLRFAPGDRVGALPQGGPAALAAFFDPQVARLRIQRMRALLMHRNVYTGRRYCDEPAIALIEIAQDETLFSRQVDALAPAFRIRIEQAFQDWLRLRYKDDKGLLRAWSVFGRSPLLRGEGLGTGKRIALMPTSEFAVATMSHSPEKQKRGQDQMRFFHEIEQRYWSECHNSVRQVGVKVPVTGTSGAAAGFMTRAHLLGQSQMDFVDRHGFWDLPAGEGEQGGRVATCLFHNLPMVKETSASNRARRELGMGNLVLGKSWEQVLGKPMVIGGWNTCLPNEHSLEGPGLMAAYGLLQGWDAILELGYLNPRWLSQPSSSPFDLLGNPAQLLQFPAVATMFYRQDVKEAPLMAEMLFGTDEVFAWADDKLPLPQEAALVGKVGYRFTASPRAAALEQVAGLWNAATRSARSVTGELTWNASEGLVTIETPRTQAMIGFLGNGERRLNSMMIATPTRFGAVWVTAMDGERPISAAAKILITLVGPTRNTGLEYGKTGQTAPNRETPYWRVTQEGTSPLMMESIRGEVRVRSQHAERLKAFVLDLNGRRRGEVPVKSSPGFVTLTLSPERRTVYYELALE